MGKSVLKRNLVQIIFGLLLVLAISYCIVVAATHDAEPPSVNRSSVKLNDGWYSFDEKGQEVSINIPRTKENEKEEHFTIYNQIPMDVKDGSILLQWMT